jgi:hypothetical protein
MKALYLAPGDAAAFPVSVVTSLPDKESGNACRSFPSHHLAARNRLLFFLKMSDEGEVGTGVNLRTRLLPVSPM